MQLENRVTAEEQSLQAHRPAGRPLGLQFLLGCMVLLAVAIPPARTHAQTHSDDTPFHIGFSSANFTDVNENDAIAAVRVWSQALARERGIPADPQPKVLRGAGEIEAALTNNLLDAINMTVPEDAAIRSRVELSSCVVSIKGGSVTEEYVLLVHRQGGIERLEDLRGHKVGLLNSARGVLAPAWFETLLARQELGSPATFCGEVISSSKVSKAVLPVFFKQCDACVVTRSGFETMVELNPQTGQQLKVLATSPPLVPVIFCFRAGFSPSIRTKLLGEIAKWDTTPAGRQLLTVFQCDGLVERPVSCLDSALELLAEHQKLCSRTNSVLGEAASMASAQAAGGAK